MYVEPASAQAIALSREGGAPCFAAARPVMPRCASNHGCAQECMASNRLKSSKAATAQREQRAGRQCSANGPGTRHICAVRVALCRVTYHERAAGDARSRGRCKGAAGDAKGRQAMHGVADDARSGGRCTGAAGDARERRAMQRGCGRCTGLRTMHGAVGDVRGGVRCSGSGVRCSETVYDAISGGRCKGAADDAWSGGRCKGAVGDARSGGRCTERRTMHVGGGRCKGAAGDAWSDGRCMERRAMHGATGDAWSDGRCMERRTMQGERQAMH